MICEWSTEHLKEEVLNFQIPPLERSPSAQPCSSVIWRQNGCYAAHDFFSFVSSLKLSRRLLCSVRFFFVSTFNLQRGSAFVDGITEQIGCLRKGKSSGRPRVSEEKVRRIEESFERSPRKSTRRASRELGIPQPTGVCWGAVYCSFESIFLNHSV